MPEERAALPLNAIEAFNKARAEAILPYLDPSIARATRRRYSSKSWVQRLASPEIEWWAPREWLEDRLYKGHDGVRQRR